MDGDARTLYHPDPCRRHVCGDRVELISGLCVACGAKYLRPLPGPQTDFLASEADVALFNGGMGSGKTRSLLLDWLRHSRVPGANGLILRNRSKDITIGGGLWDDAKELFAGTAGRTSDGRPINPRWREGNAMDMRWPSGAKLSFRHVTEDNVENFKGPGFSWIGLEEANEIPMSVIIWLLLRNRSTCGARPVMRLTCNPDRNHQLAQWVAPYLTEDGYSDRAKSGMILYMLRSAATDQFVFSESRAKTGALAEQDPELALTFSSIGATLVDNVALDQTDKKYRSKFAMMTASGRKRFAGGNWFAGDDDDGMLPLTSFGYVKKPVAPIIRMIRAWDPASKAPHAGNKDPDFTVGALMGWDIHGRWYLMDLAVTRDEPPGVDKLMASTAARDAQRPECVVTHVLEIEPGTGLVAVQHWKRVLKSCGENVPVIEVRATKDKPTKAAEMSRELVLGMDGNSPRTLDMEDDGSGTFAWRGAFLVGLWCSQTYKNPGDHPPTKLALAEKMIDMFFKGGSVKDDIPDAMAIAHNAGSKPVLTRPSDLDRHRRMAGLSK